MATWGGLVREVAREWHLEVPDEIVDWILWEQTGFPGFWDGDPVERCTEQLEDFFGRWFREQVYGPGLIDRLEQYMLEHDVAEGEPR